MKLQPKYIITSWYCVLDVGYYVTWGKIRTSKRWIQEFDSTGYTGVVSRNVALIIAFPTLRNRYSFARELVSAISQVSVVDTCPCHVPTQPIVSLHVHHSHQATIVCPNDLIAANLKLHFRTKWCSEMGLRLFNVRFIPPNILLYAHCYTWVYAVPVMLLQCGALTESLTLVRRSTYPNHPCSPSLACISTSTGLQAIYPSIVRTCTR